MAEEPKDASRTADSGGEASPEGLSAFVAKVLNQLSLSSWLPAATFAFAVAILAQFSNNRDWSISWALKGIAENWLQVLLLGVPILVLTTLITQAFSFGAIRALEGYWILFRPARWLRSLMIRRHTGRKHRLEVKRERAAMKAFGAVRYKYLQIYSTPVVNALELQALQKNVPPLPQEDGFIYRQLSWRNKCNPWDLALIEQLDQQLDDYPLRQGRIMPTKLGNVMRSTEDLLRNTPTDVQGFAFRRREFVSARVQLQHDQFRDRLDMYCTLVFVSMALAIVSLAMLWDRLEWWQTVTCSAVFALFSPVCYGSAIASARGYCTILKVMDADPEPGGS